MNEFKDCRILLVDDTRTNIDMLVQALRGDYKLGVALNGQKALEYASANHPDLILLDILMPGMDGFDVCRELKDDPKTRDIPIIFITAMDSTGDKSKGFEIGAVDYIIKPFDIIEVKARVKTHLSLKIAQEALRNQNAILDQKVRERTEELEAIQLEILERLGLATEYHDEDTGNHIKRMSRFCGFLGKAIGMSEKDVMTFTIASTMHDVGKIGISEKILRKPGKLNSEEIRIMRTHTTIGAKILSGSEYDTLQQAEIIARTHHERWDGKGYNDGLKAEEIPLLGRITCICDVFDALISERPYKKAWPVEKAFAEIQKGAGTHFDPQLVKMFIELKPEILHIIEEYR